MYALTLAHQRLSDWTDIVNTYEQSSNHAELKQRKQEVRAHVHDVLRQIDSGVNIEQLKTKAQVKTKRKIGKTHMEKGVDTPTFPYKWMWTYTRSSACVSIMRYGGRVTDPRCLFCLCADILDFAIIVVAVVIVIASTGNIEMEVMTKDPFGDGASIEETKKGIEEARGRMQKGG